MQINNANAGSAGIPLMIDPTFLGDKKMPVFYASVFGTRYYGKTPQAVEAELRKLIPSTPRPTAGRMAPPSVNARYYAAPDPWEEKRIAQAEAQALTPNSDYMNVPYLSVLGLPKEMNGMRVKRGKTRTAHRRKSQTNTRRNITVTAGHKGKRK